MYIHCVIKVRLKCIWYISVLGPPTTQSVSLLLWQLTEKIIEKRLLLLARDIKDDSVCPFLLDPTYNEKVFNWE